MESCLFSNFIEFDGIKIWIIHFFPYIEKFERRPCS
nr:MAG TPA: hypothetical protein [Caudoviricetes sp.]